MFLAIEKLPYVLNHKQRDLYKLSCKATVRFQLFQILLPLGAPVHPLLSSPLTRHHVLVWRQHYTPNRRAVFHRAITVINTWFRKSTGKHIQHCQCRNSSRLKRKENINTRALFYGATIQVQLKYERANVSVCSIYQSYWVMSPTPPRFCVLQPNNDSQLFQLAQRSQAAATAHFRSHKSNGITSKKTLRRLTL